jgi:ornithine cyclodeaminase/alanine dehydrogenase-like protein (mu-crystallin family)
MTDPLTPDSPDVLIISAAECSDLLDLGELRQSLERALMAHSNGEADVPPRIAARSEAGLLAAMPGNIAGMGMAAKLVSVFPGNHGTAVPSHQAIVTLFDQDDGRPLAMMDGTYLTAIRTGAAAALAADLAARPDATSLAVIGAGVQGHAATRTFASIRRWTDIRVASRTATNARTLAAATPGARAVATFEEAVRGADVVALCTDASQPVIDHAWLARGTHVSSVGGTGGGEIDGATMAAADRVLVEWRGATTNAPPAGAHELQGIDPAKVIEVGEVLAGRAEARSSPDDLTVYKSTGHAVEDIAAALVIYNRAVATGVGVRVQF